MIKTKTTAALEAIQGIVIQARMLAYNKVPYEQIADLLDQCEYLPGLILEADDRTDQFDQALKDIGTRFPGCRPAWEKFNSSGGDD